MTTSFGIHSAVMLHLVTSYVPNIPVIWIDTGYLPPETYVFAEQLIQSLNLNIKVFAPSMTAARMEALFGKMWESEEPGVHEKYGYVTKVEPMRRAMSELGAHVCLIGLRADQTSLRQGLQVVNKTSHDGEWKICPILGWTDADLDQYMLKVSWCAFNGTGLKLGC